MAEVKEISLQDMGPLREATQNISRFLEKKLRGYLSTLGALFSPRRILGEFMESAYEGKMLGAEKNFEEISERYKELARDPFEIPTKLGSPVPNIKNQLEIYPWEYVHELGDPSQAVRISSPVKWVLAYPSACDLRRLIEARMAEERPRQEDLRQFVIQSLTLASLVEKSPGLQEILEDLRFPVAFETSPVSGKLPYVVVRAALPAFRPQDEVVQTATQLSGKRFFEELIDASQIGELRDPIKETIVQLT